MGDALDIVQFIYEQAMAHPGDVPLVVTGVLLLAVVLTLFREPTEAFLERAAHRRNRLRVLAIVLATALSLVLFRCGASSNNFGAFVVLWVLLAVLASLTPASLRPISIVRFRDHWVRAAYERLRDGTYANATAWYESNHPIVCLDRRGQIELALVRYLYLSEENRHAEAINTLRGIDHELLYEEELTEVRIYEAMELMQLGDVRGAGALLEDLAARESAPLWWYAHGLVADLQGDSQAAFSDMSKARDLAGAPEMRDATRSAIYSNYGRAVMALGRVSEGAHMLDLAWACARESKDARYLLEMAGDRLRTLQLDGASPEECSAFVREVEMSLAHPSLPKSRIALANMRNSIHDMTGDDDLTLLELMNLYASLSGGKSGSGRHAFVASLFEAAMRHRLRLDWLDDDIAKFLQDAGSLDPSGRLELMRRYDGAIRTLDGYMLCKTEPYASLWDKIDRYRNGRASAEIEALLSEAGPSEVYRYKWLRTCKAWAVAGAPDTKALGRVERIYTELAGTLGGAGLGIAAVFVRQQLEDISSSLEAARLRYPNRTHDRGGI